LVLEAHDHSQVPVQVLYAELVVWRIAGQPIRERLAAFGGQHVKEVVKGASLPRGQSRNALFGRGEATLTTAVAVALNEGPKLVSTTCRPGTLASCHPAMMTQLSILRQEACRSLSKIL